METLNFSKFKDSDLFSDSEIIRIKKHRKLKMRLNRLANIKKWMPSKRKRKVYYKTVKQIDLSKPIF